MKKQHEPIFICFYGLILTIFINCTSTASNTETVTSAPFFTGSGGSGMRLGIIVPQSQGLNENQAYLPLMVQGVLVTNMSKYSAISILDRVSLDRVIAETLDPTYEDNLDIVRLGHVTQVGYMMTGNIIRTSTGFSLQINVTDTMPNANTVASHSGSYTVAQFDNHSAIQIASLDLLTQMGVELTATARSELNRVSSQQSIEKQTSMAQGIVAQRNGQTVEAILHYFNASELESIAEEALTRMSIATTTIATGSLGNQIRNDIQQRNEWVRLIEETRRFFANNPQYSLVELHYSPRLNLSSINYDRETANLSFPVQVRLNNERTQTIAKIVNDIHNGLEATGRRQQWGINVSVGRVLFAYIFDFDLLDERGKVISSVSTNAFILYWEGKPTSRFTLLPYIRNPNGYIIGDFSSSSSLPVITGDLVGVNNSVDNRNFVFVAKAADITDTLSIRLKNISVYDLVQRNINRRGVVNPNNVGNNIIPVRIGTF